MRVTILKYLYIALRGISLSHSELERFVEGMVHLLNQTKQKLWYTNNDIISWIINQLSSSFYNKHLETSAATVMFVSVTALNFFKVLKSSLLNMLQSERSGVPTHAAHSCQGQWDAAFLIISHQPLQASVSPPEHLSIKPEAHPSLNALGFRAMQVCEDPVYTYTQVYSNVLAWQLYRAHS